DGDRGAGRRAGDELHGGGGLAGPDVEGADIDDVGPAAEVHDRATVGVSAAAGGDADGGDVDEVTAGGVGAPCQGEARLDVGEGAAAGDGQRVGPGLGGVVEAGPGLVPADREVGRRGERAGVVAHLQGVGVAGAGEGERAGGERQVGAAAGERAVEDAGAPAA